MDTVCNVCDGTEFTVNAGFYYCDNCGQQATTLQEVEDQADGQFDDIQKKSHKIKKTVQTQNSELTSWETYNYIIYEFVNELIQLGCKDELTLMTLQLWSAYLRKNEIAFFGKKETKIPKFSFKYKHRDVRLIYSLPVKKRRPSSTTASSAGSSENLTLRQSKIALRKKKQLLANAQYEEYMSSQKTDISSLGFNLGSQKSSTGPSSDNTDTTIRIKYSRRTRQKLSKKISREHLTEHQNDIGRKLKCHNIKDREVLGRTFVFAMLWLALNQIGDTLQISDLIRYAKESHIKLNNISTFLPPTIDAKQAVNHFRKSSNDNLTHAFLRTKALTIARIIGIQNVIQPDLTMLCERYCKDLCLPSAIAEMVKRLIAFNPPEMKMSETSALSRTVPNFEGRAMAYIIFILKLFFGVDDKRENDISASAQVINHKLIECDSKQQPLFVWSEWVEYIEMRNTILSQCHYPTAMEIDPNTSMHTNMYIDYLKRTNEDSTYNERYRKVEMENIRLVFDQIVKLHEDNQQTWKPSCQFQPSLTPFSSYMEEILDDRAIKSKIYVPEFMNVDHEKRDIIPYLKPKRLKKIFRSMKQQLEIKEIGFNPNLQFAHVRHENRKTTTNVQFEFDVTRAEWLDLIKERDDKKYEAQETNRKMENDEIGEQIAEHLANLRTKQIVADAIRKANHTDNSSTNPTANVAAYQYFDEEEKDIVDDIVLNEPRRNLDKQSNMLNYQSSDDDDDDGDSNDEMIKSDHDLNGENEDSIEFIISNFDYWIAMQNIYYITNASFVDSVNVLPKHFQWLLKQCALQIHMHIKDLYIELLAIENQFRYVLKPIFKMDNYIKLRTPSTTKLHPQTISAMKNLKRIW
ncbi:TATA box-binding protein-associated factor RNA polymerase I subunit B [Contarinia nasturtii]|uniref:TATA box-binding protein-associated factor RNA polymerase I subunit B n=1 Tax=Contarinia nasturtii TaxID=265458 RepID=UPI0012D3C33B|nr:TATA box-binding protein-associated factor RNA polymerase I subunit B [Contarinia nasturtii]